MVHIADLIADKEMPHMTAQQPPALASSFTSTLQQQTRGEGQARCSTPVQAFVLAIVQHCQVGQGSMDARAGHVRGMGKQ
jgi:hypothetical protein